MSMPSLLEGLVAWWSCDEDASAGHTLMDSSGNGHHFATEGSDYDTVNATNWGTRSAESTDGKLSGGVSPRWLYKLSESALQIGGGSFSIVFWFRIPAEHWDKAIFLFEKGNPESTPYEVRIEFGGDLDHTLIVRTKSGLFDMDGDCSPLLEPDTWYQCQVWRDQDLNTLGIAVNNAEPDTSVCFTDEANQSATDNYPLWLGTTREDRWAELDEIAIWNRAITPEERSWLYNNGSGRVYAAVDAETNDETQLGCKVIACCPPDDFNNNAECAATEASVAVPIVKECTEAAQVSFDPPNGITVIFPIFVRLISSVPGATIRYTTDGSEPLPSSPAYTTPLAIANASVTVKARAYVTGCPDGEIAVGTWVPYTQESILFCFKGPNGDFAGQWGVFTGDGQTDLNFWLAIENAAPLAVKRLELYQLDTNYRWTTGQAWSTDEYITPPFDTWPDKNATFHVFPLLIYDQGPNQINNAYTTDFGTIAAGTNYYDLYGQPVVPATGYFVLILFMADGSEVRAFSDITICDNPPPCPPLDPPILTPLCKRIDIDLNVPGDLAKAYQVYAAPCSDPTAFILIASGNAVGAIATINYTGLQPDCEYCFYWRVNWAGDPDFGHCLWISSATVCATTTCEPSASLTVEPEVCLGNSFTLEYVTSCAGVPVIISLLAGNAGDLDVVFPVTVLSNVSGSLEVTASAVGSWTFRLSAPGIVAGCDPDTSDADVQVIETPDQVSDCSDKPTGLIITSWRMSSAANPLQPITHDTVQFIIHSPNDPTAPVPCATYRGPFGCFASDGTTISFPWNFVLFAPNKAVECFWKMPGQIVRGNSPGTPNSEGTLLAVNKPPPDTEFYFMSRPSGNTTAIFSDGQYWYLRIVGKLLCSGFSNVVDCYDFNGAVLWRGLKDCALGPRGEYVNDGYFAAPDAVVQTRPENGGIYSMKVS